MNEDFQNESQQPVVQPGATPQPDIATPSSQATDPKKAPTVGRFFADFFVVLGCGVLLMFASFSYLMNGVNFLMTLVGPLVGDSQWASMIVYIPPFLLPFALPAVFVNSRRRKQGFGFSRGAATAVVIGPAAGYLFLVVSVVVYFSRVQW